MRVTIFVVLIALLAGRAQAGDWTGPYAGVQAGQINGGTDPDGTRTTYGAHGGYDFDYGRLVLGGEIEVAHMHGVQGAGQISGQISGQTPGTVGRLKFRAGHDFGSTMAYAVLGGVNGDTQSGSETGVVYGLGLLAAMGERLTLSGEALRQVFGNFANSGSSLKTDSFTVRVSFRF